MLTTMDGDAKQEEKTPRMIAEEMLETLDAAVVKALNKVQLEAASERQIALSRKEERSSNDTGAKEG